MKSGNLTVSLTLRVSPVIRHLRYRDTPAYRHEFHLTLSRITLLYPRTNDMPLCAHTDFVTYRFRDNSRRPRKESVGLSDFFIIYSQNIDAYGRNLGLF